MRCTWLGWLLLAGCATFESGELPGLDRWPPAVAPAVASQRGEVLVTVEGLPNKFVAGWQRVAERVLVDSQRFAGVAGTDGSSVVGAGDRHLQLLFTHTRSNLWLTRSWMFVCAMSAAVIPARTAQQFGIRAVITDGTGTQLGVVERQVEGVTWVGWLPLFAMPFAGAGLGSLIEDTMRSIVVEGAEKGWL